MIHYLICFGNYTTARNQGYPKHVTKFYKNIKQLIYVHILQDWDINSMRNLNYVQVEYTFPKTKCSTFLPQICLFNRKFSSKKSFILDKNRYQPVKVPEISLPHHIDNNKIHRVNFSEKMIHFCRSTNSQLCFRPSDLYLRLENEPGLFSICYTVKSRI